MATKQVTGLRRRKLAAEAKIKELEAQKRERLEREAAAASDVVAPTFSFEDGHTVALPITDLPRADSLRESLVLWAEQNALALEEQFTQLARDGVLGNEWRFNAALVWPIQQALRDLRALRSMLT